jgi:hypothetical protein
MNIFHTLSVYWLSNIRLFAAVQRRIKRDYGNLIPLSKDIGKKARGNDSSTKIKT